MKKKIFTLMFLACSTVMQAGGLLHNTNQSIAWQRMMARGATHEIDGVFTNPAGTAFLGHEGWTLSLNIQSATQKRDVLTTFSLFPTQGNTKLYEGKASAPVIPSFYAAYKRGKWAYSGFFGFVGGGGKSSFDSGLPIFDAGIMAGYYSQTANLRNFGRKSCYSPRSQRPAYGRTASAHRRQIRHQLVDEGSPVYLRPSVGCRLSNQRALECVCWFAHELFQRQLQRFCQGVAQRHDSRYRAAALPALVNNNGELANIELDCNQTGWGVTPILSVNYKTGPLTLAAKYEFKTKLEIENDTETAIAEPAAFESALNDYKHGVNTPNDLPSVLYVAAGYEIIPNKLRAAVEYHYYDDKNAGMAKDKQKALRHGTHEVLAGVEWDINETFTVSCGYQNTDYGLSDDYQTHTAFSCDSYSIGLGGAINVSEKVRLNLGYFWTTYKDYTKEVAAGNPGYCNTTLPGKDVYSRTNKVFGIGIDYKF